MTTKVKRKAKALRLEWRGGDGGQWTTDLRRYRKVLGESDPSRTGLFYPLGKDRDAAELKLLEVVRELDQRKRDIAMGNRPAPAKTADSIRALVPKFVERWVRQRAQRRPRTPEAIAWLRDTALFRFGEYVGWDRSPRSVTVEDLTAWLDALMTNPGPTKLQREQGQTRGRKPLSAHQVNHHFAAVHMFFAWMTPGHNPVAHVEGRPSGNEEDVKWLPHGDVADLLAASFDVERDLPPEMEGKGCLAEYTHTLFLTGCRATEVKFLELGDVDFEDNLVHVRPNSHRKFLKNDVTVRTVPLWPQLREVLEPYIAARREAGATDASLLFERPDGLPFGGPSVKNTGAHAAWRVLLKATGLDVQRKGARHSYCAQRLQTLDGGAPVSPYTVSRELGHTDLKMVTRVYAKLGKVRVRTEGVEFRRGATVRATASTPGMVAEAA